MVTRVHQPHLHSGGSPFAGCSVVVTRGTLQKKKMTHAPYSNMPQYIYVAIFLQSRVVCDRAVHLGIRFMVLPAVV